MPEFYEISDAGFDVHVRILSSPKLTVNTMVTLVCQINSINVSCTMRYQRDDRAESFVKFRFDGDNTEFR